jgi:hypothetical protein
MNENPQATTALEKKDELDRRQFLNGLGKWSLAVIAAVTSLRDGFRDEPGSVGPRFDSPTTGQSDRLRQIAKKKRPHGDQPHIDEPHNDSPGQPHRDYYRREAPKEGGTTAPTGGVKTR